MNRNAEPHVSQPQRPLDEVFLVAEEAAERHARMIGRGKQYGDRDDTGRDRRDQHGHHPAPLVAVDVLDGGPDDKGDRDGTPDREGRQRVHHADRHARSNRQPPGFPAEAERCVVRHAITSVNTRSYAAATDGTPKRSA